MRVKFAKLFGMVIGPTWLYSRNPGGSLSRICGVLALAALFHPLEGSAAQKPGTAQSRPGPSSQKPSPFHEAETLLAQGQIAAARAKILEQLKLHPSSVEGYNLLGISFSDEKNYADALEAFQHALKLDPRSARTLNNLGSLDAAQGKTDLAEREFRKVLALQPANRDANYNLGLLLMAKGSAAEAVPLLRRVRPANKDVLLALTRGCFKTGKTAEGLQAARDLSGMAKDDAQVHTALGVLLASEKQYAAAELEFEKAGALQPESFEILYDLGLAYLRDAKYAKAEVQLNRALKLQPESAETLASLGQAVAQQNRPVDALGLLVRAHKLAPENTDIILLLARISMSQNYFEDSIPLLESGLKIAPQRADLLAALGESYFQSGKSETAIAEFQKLLELEPSARSYAYLGLSFLHLGRFDEAQKYFSEGLKKDPKNIACLFNTGVIEQRRGDNARAEALFSEVLRANPDFPDALLALANLRLAKKNFADSAVLLRRFVRVSPDPAPGYYKLAIAERALHQTAAAQRDLNVFQTLSKNPAAGPVPFTHIFDYLESRSNLAPQERTELDLEELTDEVRKHPDQPRNLYLLAETYLKLGKPEEAAAELAQLDKISADDYRTQAGVGVLLARFRLYDEAIQHFQAALNANPDSDDVKFNLADAYFRKGAFAEALRASEQVSPSGQKDDAFLALLGDIEARLGDTAQAMEIFRSAIRRNPDADQYYLSLALAQLRSNDLRGAEETLQNAVTRIPSSGKILWGLGIVSVLQGKKEEAASRFERAVDLLPEWPGGYSTLGIFYFQTGEIAKAREVLHRFKGSGAGGLDVNRIEEALSKAPGNVPASGEPMPMAARYQFLQLALSLADRTL